MTIKSRLKHTMQSSPLMHLNPACICTVRRAGKGSLLPFLPCRNNAVGVKAWHNLGSLSQSHQIGSANLPVRIWEILLFQTTRDRSITGEDEGRNTRDLRTNKNRFGETIRALFCSYAKLGVNVIRWCRAFRHEGILIRSLTKGNLFLPLFKTFDSFVDSIK